MNQSELEDIIFRAGIEALQPEPYLTVTEWAEENRILSNMASSEPGK